MDLFDALEIPIVFTDVEAAAVALEACETPRWAAQAGIGCADLQHRVLDPCVGRGVLAETAIAAGHDVRSGDIYGWEYDGPRLLCDFLSTAAESLVEGWEPQSFDVFMNPPFSKACEFVDRALELGAYRVLSFQRFAWLESQVRKSWWDSAPCSRVFLLADRVTWWWFHIPKSDRKGNTPTVHAWFEFTADHPSPGSPPPMQRIYRGDLKK